MKLQGRKLEQGTVGDDVALLHEELAAIGATVDPAERKAKAFKDSTAKVIMAFQRRNGLQPTGVVDEPTAAAINKAFDATQPPPDRPPGRPEPVPEPGARVGGHVLTDGRAPLGGVTVTVVDVSLAGERALGQATTSSDGAYSLAYDPALLDGKAAPDLRARAAGAAGTVLGTSAVRYNAPADAVVDVVVPAARAATTDEYQQLVGDLGAHLAGTRLADVKEDAERADLSYLANKTGWDARMVAMASLAGQLADSTGVQPPFWYALLRAGLPAALDSVSQTDPAMVEGIWKRAIEDKIIPAELAGALPATLKRFGALGAGRLLERAPLAGPSGLSDLLGVAGLDDAGRQRFADLYHQAHGNLDAFWRRAGQALGSDVTKRLRVAGRLGYLTVNNAPLMTKLATDAGGAAEPADPADLVRRGLYDPKAWDGLLSPDVAVPAQIPGADDGERRARYAELMAAQLTLSYPTKVVAAMIDRRELDLNVPDQVRASVHGFLDGDAGFELGMHPVDAFVRGHRLKVDDATLGQLRTLSRVYQISPGGKALAGLVAGGVDSAYAVAQYRKREFVGAFSDRLGGEGAAALAWDKARQVHNAVANVASAYLARRAAPGMHVLGNGDGQQSPVEDEPTLAELFGPASYLACDHCGSVLSPAAYLVDLLQFLELRRFNSQGVELPPAFTGADPVEVLLGRRPDLAHMALSCDNTNTVLPYIDLVNEVLEYFVAHSLSLTGFTGHDVPEGVSSAELLASPQFVDAAAYGALENAVYPLGLPFSADLAALRARLAAAGVPLPGALEALRADEALGTWRDILSERLGLSHRQRALLTDGSIPVQRLYGEDPATVTEAGLVAAVSGAATFARRLGLDYQEVIDLLQVEFVNPGVRLLPRVERLGVSFSDIERLHDGRLTAQQFAALLPGDLDPGPYGGDVPAWVAAHHDAIVGLIVLADPSGGQDVTAFEDLELRHALPDMDANHLTPLELRRLVRFVRLARALGWSLALTGKAVSALWPAAQAPAPGDSQAALAAKLDAGFAELLVRLGHVQGALDTLGLNPARDLTGLLACVAPLDTYGPGSLYRALFLNPTVLGIDDVFGEDPGGGFPKAPGAKLLDHLPALQAAVNLGADDLALLTGALGYGATTPLDLGTISTVYRHAWLARRLRRSIAELLALLELTGLDPFGPPSGAGPDLPAFLERDRLLRAAGVSVPRLAWYLGGQDPTGKAGPSEADTLDAARTLRGALLEAGRQTTVADDPTGEVTRARMAMVYGDEATGTFFGLLNRSASFSTAYDHGRPTLEAAVLAAAPGLAYDDFAKLLTSAGVLTQAERDAVHAIAGVRAELAAAVDALYAAGQAQTAAFSARYPDLAALYAAFADSTGPLPARMAALQAAFLPQLRDQLARQQVRQQVAAETGVSPQDAAALLEDPAILHAGADTATGVMADYLAVAGGGLSARWFFADDVTGSPDARDDAVTVDFRPGGGTLPGNPAATVSGVLSGWLETPTTGLYNLLVEADAGAQVRLRVDGADVPLAAAGGTWHNTAPVQLAAGRPVAVELTARGVRRRLVLRWETRGMAREAVPATALYPAVLIGRWSAGRLRLAKALALAGQLHLTGAELRHFAADPADRLGGQGWLNSLPADTPPPAATVRALFAVVVDLLRWAELRGADGADAEALLAAVAATPVDQGAVARAAGWAEADLSTVLSRLGLTAADLAKVPALARVAEAVGVATTLGVPATAAFAAVTAAPGPAAVSALEHALRAHYDEAAWLEVAGPVNDGLRAARRDALVAHVLHGLGADPATAHIDTQDKLFELFLIDVAMDPCMKTSRIKQAISTVQLFTQRCLLNLEPSVDAGSINAKRWAWMKRYRVWEANRKVFLWPENWLEPELRDDKSPFFTDLEGELLQSDITDDTAALALGHYLEQLAEVARLEICAMYVEENDGSTTADDVIHVIGRSPGARRTYWYRNLRGGTWSPWRRVDVQVEDNPVGLVVWQGRLLLFWLGMAGQQGQPGQGATTATGAKKLADVQVNELRSAAAADVAVTLHYSEHWNGKWQPPRSSDPFRPLSLGTFAPGGFDRGKLVLATIFTSAGLIVSVQGQGSGGSFTLYTPHSLPVRAEDELGGLWQVGPIGHILLRRARSFSTTGGLSVDYFDPFDFNDSLFSQLVLEAALPYQVVDPHQPLTDAFAAPFFVQDNRRVFSVRPTVSSVKVYEFGDVGIQHQPPSAVPVVPPSALKPDWGLALPDDPGPYPPDVYRPGAIDPSPLKQYLSVDINLSRTIASGGAVAFNGVLIGPGGAIGAREVQR